MQIHVVKSIAGCVLAASVLAGCASQSPITASAGSRNVQDGRVVSIEPATIIAQPTTSLGSGTSGGSGSSGASSGEAAYAGQASVVTVRFADGSQNQYAIAERPNPAFETGEAVKVITDADSVVLIAP